MFGLTKFDPELKNLSSVWSSLSTSEYPTSADRFLFQSEYIKQMAQVTQLFSNRIFNENDGRHIDIPQGRRRRQCYD